MVGVAILGAGDIANVHIEAYKELAGRCRIVALADIYTDKAEEKKQKSGLDCDVVEDYKELLDREDVDLVSVCLPPAAHCGVAVDFLKATTKSLLDSHLEDGNYITARDKHVVVIGGGDTGNDCVGTAIRHGCASVTQLEMMPKPPVKRADDNTWPEWPRVLKTDYGQEEAICVFGHDPRVYQTTVKEFVKDAEGRVCKATTIWPRDLPWSQPCR